MSPPSVRATGEDETSRFVAVVGSGNTDSTLPRGRQDTYQVSPPRLVARFSRSVMLRLAESCFCPSQIPDGDPIPGLTHRSPRPIAALTASSGLLAQVE